MLKKVVLPLCSLLIALVLAQPALAQHQHSMEGQNMAMGAASPDIQAAQAKHDQESKDFSEFNHRMAGLFVLLTGVVVLAHSPIERRWPNARYAWPLFLFIPGLYLLFLSDPESWPIGPQSLSYVVTVNHQVFQHKLFSLLLLALGVFEFERVRGRIAAAWSALVFPVLALGGSILLLFHVHPPGGHTPQMMLSMMRIEQQHLRFAFVGVLIAGSKGLSEVDWRGRRLFNYAWPALMIVLGVLLMMYTE